MYLDSILQVTSCGSTKYKPITDRVDVSVQKQVLEKIAYLKLEQNNISSSVSPTKHHDDIHKSPISPLKHQSLEQTCIPDTDLLIACMRITN